MRSIGRGPLNSLERTNLRNAEKTIEKGQETFIDVGNALMLIRDGNLFRETHKTFRAYCREKWGFEDSRARQLIGGAERAKRLESVTRVTLLPPSGEKQLRPLAKLPEDQQADAWADAVVAAGGVQPTTSQVEKVVNTYLADNEPYQEPATTEPAPPKKPPKSGQQKKDPRLWQEIEQHLGKALNRVDALNKQYPNGPMHKTLGMQVKQAMKTLAAWKESIA